MTPFAAANQESRSRSWQSLLWFNVYRLTVALLLFSTSKFIDPFPFGLYPPIFGQIAAAYFLFGLFSYFLLVKWRISIDAVLTILITGDSIFIGLLLYLAGGSNSGLSLLLIPALVGVGLIGRGRLALFHAGIATLALLTVDALHSLQKEVVPGDLARIALISVGYFATAWLAHYLGRLTRLSETLAYQRGIDLVNLQEVNATIVQEMALGILVVDRDGKIQAQNVQAADLLGLNPRPGVEDNPTPRRLGLLKPNFKTALVTLAAPIAEKLAYWQQNAPNADLTDSAFFTVSLPNTQKLLRIRFIATGQNRQAGALIFIEDLAEVQAQAQQLKLVALGRLTANIAHEIRNPLGAVGHATQLLQEGHLEQQPRLLQIIHNNVQRIDRIVNEAMQLARRDLAQPESLMVHPLLTTLLEDVRVAEQIPAKIIVLQCPENLLIHFDPGHFSQILWNLVRNAWQHSRQQPASVRIDLTASPESNSVSCTVSDDGPGVPSDLQGQLFEPFFTTRPGGTGLGLYLARELAEVNHARLDYIAQTTGACFRLVLPRPQS